MQYSEYRHMNKSCITIHKRYKSSVGFSGFSFPIKIVFNIPLFVWYPSKLTMVSFDFLHDSLSEPGLYIAAVKTGSIKNTWFLPLDLNVHLFPCLHVQVSLPVSSCKHSLPMVCLLLLLTVISQRNTGCECTRTAIWLYMWCKGLCFPQWVSWPDSSWCHSTESFHGNTWGWGG